MIASTICYLRPDSAEEAVGAWTCNPGSRYLSGGTEISTMARRSASYPVSYLIDIKRIAETTTLHVDEDMLMLGASLPLSNIADSGYFPLLTSTIQGIADRTTRNRLSLGGNIAGSLPYREAVIPLLLADARCTSIVPGNGSQAPQRKEWQLRERFNKRLLLEPGELLLSCSIPRSFTSLPWSHQRRTRTGRVDYPLVTLCLVKDATRYVLGVSGAHPYPLRTDDADAALSTKANNSERIDNALLALGLPTADHRASAEYRAALLKIMLEFTLKKLS